MRTVFVKVAIFAMLPLWLGLGCKKSPMPSQDVISGEVWLNMNIEERTQAVAGYIDGHGMGAFQACSLLTNVFEVNHTKEILEEEKRSNLTDAQLCMRKAGEYSRINRNTAFLDKYATYVNVITDFYQRYPSERYVPPFLLLLNMQDGFDTTVEQLHDSVKNPLLRRH